MNRTILPLPLPLKRTPGSFGVLLSDDRVRNYGAAACVRCALPPCPLEITEIDREY